MRGGGDWLDLSDTVVEGFEDDTRGALISAGKSLTTVSRKGSSIVVILCLVA